jgi:sulfur carrier protein
MLELTINGRPRSVPEPLTVRDLLLHLELHPETIVVELNREILPRSRYDEVALKADDRLELVHFVGGG